MGGTGRQQEALGHQSSFPNVWVSGRETQEARRGDGKQREATGGNGNCWGNLHFNRKLEPKICSMSANILKWLKLHPMIKHISFAQSITIINALSLRCHGTVNAQTMHCHCIVNALSIHCRQFPLTYPCAHTCMHCEC